ncbi:hypothetical protein QG37_00339 [Candidozyma auris]|nr:hypothetical protein QG37_00339 [[Candida] auris]
MVKHVFGEDRGRGRHVKGGVEMGRRQVEHIVKLLLFPFHDVQRHLLLCLMWLTLSFEIGLGGKSVRGQYSSRDGGIKKETL